MMQKSKRTDGYPSRPPFVLRVLTQHSAIARYSSIASTHMDRRSLLTVIHLFYFPCIVSGSSADSALRTGKGAKPWTRVRS
jgi:hypothetical protein